MSQPRPSADAILSGLDADQRLGELHGDQEEAEWDPPAPLSRAQALPASPIDALPAWVSDQVAAVAEFTQTPPDLPGCIALACLSAAAGGHAVVEVRGSWREPVNIYTAVAMPPGSRKSAVFATMTGPLLEAEQRLVESTRPQIIEAKLARKVAQRQSERAAANAGSAGASDEALAEASDAAMQAEAIQVPPLARLVADDITTEAAASLLAEQGGRLAVLSAEGGIFQTLAGRYSNGMPSLGVFLKGHAGDLLRVDRKGREAEHIPNPALTLGLAVQPHVLREIASMPGFRDSGLLARILYALPENTVGHRKIAPDPIPDEVADAYRTNLHSLALSLHDWTDPAVLPITPDADREVQAMEADIEPRLAPGAEWAAMADWGSKLAGATVRLAGLLHLATHLRNGWGRPIEAHTIQAARRLGEYYAAHALAAFDAMGADARLDDARTVLDWITHQAQERFSKRELFRAMPAGRFKKVADLDPALEVLEQHGHIRPAPEPPRNGPGRPPSPVFHVHPDLHSQPGHGA